MKEVEHLTGRPTNISSLFAAFLLTVTQPVKKFSPFMEQDTSLLCSREPSTGLCYKLVECSKRNPTLIKMRFNIILLPFPKSSK